MLVIAHVSDVHFDGDDRSFDRARRVMDYINGLRQPVDVILVTGDIADHGLPDEYEQAKKVLVGAPPVLTCPGNHDVREAYRQILLDETAVSGPVNRAHHVAGAVFAMCDSSIPGRDDGRLDEETIDWLRGVLADAGDAPTFVCFHHPPVQLHSQFIDDIRQFDEERLADLVRAAPQVVGVLCGHAHTAAASTFAGRPLLVAPGVVSTLMLPWETDSIVDYDLPPAIAFHVLADDGRLTTHYRVIPA